MIKIIMTIFIVLPFSYIFSQTKSVDTNALKEVLKSEKIRLYGQGSGTKTTEQKDIYWILYDKNGDILLTQNYLDKSKDGEWVSFYNNGHIKSKQNYINGKAVGKLIQYTENGKLIEKKSN